MFMIRNCNQKDRLNLPPRASESFKCHSDTNILKSMSNKNIKSPVQSKTVIMGMSKDCC